MTTHGFGIMDEVMYNVDYVYYEPEDGWNVGNVGGQEIFHAHLHVIPRYKDERLSGKGIRYWLKQPHNKRNIGKK